MAKYSKPYKDIPGQLALLKSRGMVISDDARAGSYLERIGYYRLSGYWYPMRVSAAGATGSLQILDTFKAGTRFEDAADLYVFDKRLRMLMLDAIERIEVALRVSIALQLGVASPHAHLDKNLLHGNFTKKLTRHSGKTKHDKWVERYRKCISRSHEEFVKHFERKYPSQELPIWIAIEVWDFGLLSTFIGGMKNSDQSSLAINYGNPRPELFVSWIRALNDVRNACAHHARLWNKPLVNAPKALRVGEISSMDHIAKDIFAQQRLYMAAAIAQYFIKKINPTSTWSIRLKTLIASIPKAPDISIRHSGFPNGWETQSLWN